MLPFSGALGPDHADFNFVFLACLCPIGNLHQGTSARQAPTMLEYSGHIFPFIPLLSGPSILQVIRTLYVVSTEYEIYPWRFFS